MRVLVGMSGGVDSTYAALHLMRCGHEVEGCVVIMHDYTELDAARESAESLGIPLNVVDMRERFCEIVIENFITEYSRARTPNPCVICNSDVKFRALCDFAMQRGFSHIATGHYASVVRLDVDGREIYSLAAPHDTAKDQTYMLWRLPQDILSRLLLPMSQQLKSDARRISREAGLSASERADSQEICFIPDGDYASFIEKRCGSFPQGDFVDINGEVLGRHNGIIRYTVGQRRGLGIAYGERIFVDRIDAESNRIILSPTPPARDTVYISGMAGPLCDTLRVGEEYSFDVKVRYSASCVRATLVPLGEKRGVIRFPRPQHSVSAGQSAVLYRDGVLAVGGFIE